MFVSWHRRLLHDSTEIEAARQRNQGRNYTTYFTSAKPYSITAVAEYDGKQYTQGFHDVGYVGLRPYPHYRNAAMRTTGVDVKVAPGLKVGYIMGTGDDVPSSLQDVDVHVIQLSPQDIETADLSSYDAIVLGIRAYAARSRLRTAVYSST